MKKGIFGKLLLLLWLSTASMLAMGQSMVSREYFSPNTDFNDVEPEAVDDRFSDLATDLNANDLFRDKFSYGLVSLGIDPDLNICHDGPIKYKVTVQAEETIISTPGNPVIQTNTYDLIVNYDPDRGVLETENAFVRIDFARKLTLSIVEVKAIDESGTETPVATPDLMPEDIYVEAEIVRERYDNFDPTLSGSVPAPFTDVVAIFNYYQNHHVILVEWNNVPGAVEYEIEWTFASNYAASGIGNTLPSSDIHIRFRNNATSVRVPRKADNEFFIPIIYGRGVLVYRIRAIGRGGVELEDDIFGPWSLPNDSYTFDDIESNHYDSYRGIGLESGTDLSGDPNRFNNVNSQFAVQFAEDGKLLAKGTFADGSLRTRQSVAAVKIDDQDPYGKKSVITETIYDHLGRAAVTTLPAVTKNGLWYTPNYSLNEDEEKYSYRDFDIDAMANAGCTPLAEGMHNSSGASLYYSIQNADKAEGHQGLIADAKDYPFIQTVFERDNTGRPKIQSGVGEQHRMGQGHETKYIYGGAEQTQLNRLFGTDAGYAGYYQKNMIEDANGQISITYTDMAGRTVATALAGESPDNVGALTNNLGNPLAEAGEPIDEDMLIIIEPQYPHGTVNPLSSDGKSYTFSSNLLLESEQDYTFDYNAQLANFVDECFPQCLDCIYDVEISLTDECGNILIGNDDLTGPWTKIMGGLVDTICTDTSDSVALVRVVHLTPGSYTVYKKLSIHEETLDEFVEIMMQQSTCLAPPASFYNPPDLSGCEITCEQCLANIGTWEDFYEDHRGEFDLDPDYDELAENTLRPVYNSMKEECEGLCIDRTRDYCDAAYQLMQLDMSPGGQYGQYTTDPAGPMNADAYPVSILNPSNFLPVKVAAQFTATLPAGIDGSVPSWRKPVLFTPNAGTPYQWGYFDAQGQPARIHIQLDENDEYYPQVVDETLVTLVDEGSNSYSTPPENLLNLQDFVNRWQPSFAKSLVIYHPEFFQYEFCSSIYPYEVTVEGETVNSFLYDEILSNMNHADAEDHFGFTGSTTFQQLFDALTNEDPFFAQHPLSGNPGLPPVSYGPLPDLTPHNLLESRFLIYQITNIPLNIAQAAYVQNHCAYTYPTGCNTGLPIWGPVGGAAGLLHNDDTWRTFTDYYMSAKQEAILRAMNIYAIVGATPDDFTSWKLANTTCIGRNNFFASAGASGTPVMQNPCDFPWFIFYQEKERRFNLTQSTISEEFGLSEPPTAEELQQYALQGAYQQTGLCVMATDLQYLMAKLAIEQELTGTTVDMNTGSYMGSNLFQHIATESGDPDISVLYQSSVSGNVLTATMSGLDCDPFELTLPAAAVTAGYTFADIRHFFSIREISESGGEYFFKISALFQNQSINPQPETLEVVGKSCLPLTGCESAFRKLCKPTDEAKDLMNLMTTLSMEGQLFSTTAVPINSMPFSSLITPRLRFYLGDAGYYTWKYDPTPPNPRFELSNTTSAITLQLDITSLGLNPLNTYEFVSVTGSQVTATGNLVLPDFNFRAVEVDMPNYYYLPTYNPAATYVNMTGTATMVGFGQTFPITKCQDIQPLECNTPEHQALKQLEEALRLAADGINTESPFDYECFSFLLEEDQTGFSMNDVDELISLEADMSSSQNSVNSQYFTAVFKMDNASTQTIKGHSCKALRNCITCEEEPCDPNYKTFRVGPLSGFSPQTQTHMGIVFDDFNGSFGDCPTLTPTTFEYDHDSPQEFWEAWAQAINTSMGSDGNAVVEDGYLVISINTATLDKCSCSNDHYFLQDQTDKTVGTFAVECCEGENEEEACTVTTIMEFDSFPEGWFSTQTTFTQAFWGEPRTDNSLVYEESDMLIFESHCQTPVHTNFMPWNTSSTYRITYEFQTFPVLDPVDEIAFAFVDPSYNWVDYITLEHSGQHQIYYTPSQSSLQFLINVQNLEWVGGTPICTGDSKVGLKYLKIEELGPGYVVSNSYQQDYGIDGTDMSAPGATFASMGINPLNNPDVQSLGIVSQGWLNEGQLHISGACAAGFDYRLETCPGYPVVLETEILAPDAATAPTHIFAMVIDDNGSEIFGPYSPGTIQFTFTPSGTESQIIFVAVNSDSSTVDFVSIASGSELTFNDYCTDSVYFTMTHSTVLQGCTQEYVCPGGSSIPPCPTVLLQRNSFPEHWFGIQQTFTFHDTSPTNASTITEQNNQLVIETDCVAAIRTEVTNVPAGSLYHVSLDLVPFTGVDAPTVMNLQIGTTGDPTLYGDMPLTFGENDAYFVAPATSFFLNFDVGHAYWNGSTFTCTGTTKVGIENIAIERIDHYETTQQVTTDLTMDNTVLSQPGITPAHLGLSAFVNPDLGLTPATIYIDDEKVYVESTCASALRTHINTCVGYTYHGEIDITAPDPTKAPTAIYVIALAEGAGYTEVSGPFTPGHIEYEFTPTLEHIDLIVIAINSSTPVNIPAAFQEPGGLENYCTGEVKYYFDYSSFTDACIPQYTCAPASVWIQPEPFAGVNDCTPTVIPFYQPEPSNPCVEFLLETAQANADYDYQQYLNQKREEYRQLYISKCMDPVREQFNRLYTDGQYHYTLYYYDRVGNLVKTVPPHAVVPLSGTELASVNAARESNTVVVPKHNQTDETAFALSTRYRYNSLNQPVEQITPDGGMSTFYYDRLGRVAVSQNAVQKAVSTSGNRVYSYTLYDVLGRITEVGKVSHPTLATRDGLYEAWPWLNFFLPTNFVTANTHEVTRTYYDKTCADYALPTCLGSFQQNNLRSRVAFTLARPTGETDFVFGSYYDYDIHGNVKSLVHQNLYAPAAPLQENRVDYNYDLVSGVVKKVSYNTGRPDQYFHKYAYDDQNRLTQAYTSRNDIKYDQDARYFYYWHGPLARVELGQNKLQGLDYAYTIHGWLKNVNSDALRPDIDFGKDGHNDAGNNNRYFARDAYGYSLHYYVGDYTPIEAGNVQVPAIPVGYSAPDLWNGNIGAMNNTLKHPDNFGVLPLLQRFGYDQLNRIASSEAYNELDLPTNTWNASATALDVYATAYTYDPAGNLMSLHRNGDDNSHLEMDRLSYIYYPNSNKLRRVTDVEAMSPHYEVDIDQQPGIPHPLDADLYNYDYDKIGNLIKDVAEEIQEIKWTVYGKVAEVIRNGGSQKPDLKFYYDAAGRRIMKKITPKNGAPAKTEFYTHDAQGNILSIYAYTEEGTDPEENPATYKLTEQILYGSSRLGTYKSDLDLLSYIPAEPVQYVVDRGNKRYEMNDHLGNVHVVLTDRKARICEEGEFVAYEADIRNSHDYYPFGMLMPGRTFDKEREAFTETQTITEELLNEDFDDLCVSTYQEDFSDVCTQSLNEDFAWSCTTAVALEDFTPNTTTAWATHDFSSGTFNNAEFMLTNTTNGTISASSQALAFTTPYTAGLKVVLPTPTPGTYTATFNYTELGGTIPYTAITVSGGSIINVVNSAGGLVEYTFTTSTSTTDLILTLYGNGYRTASIDNFTLLKNTQDFSVYSPSGTLNQLSFSNEITYTTANTNQGVKIAIPTTTGHTYTARFNIAEVAGTITSTQISVTGNSTLNITDNSAAVEYTFTAAASSTNLLVLLVGSGSKTATIDDFEVCENAQALGYISNQGALTQLSFDNGYVDFASGATGNGINITRTTTAGETYTVSFDYTPSANVTSASLSVASNHTLVLPNTGSTQTVYYTFTAAAGTSSQVRLTLAGSTMPLSATVDNLTFCKNGKSFATYYKPYGTLSELSHANSDATFSATSNGQGLRILPLTTAGKVYTAQFDYTPIANVTSASLQINGGTATTITSGSQLVTFTAAAGTTTELRITLTGSSGTRTAKIDNFQICENPTTSLFEAQGALGAPISYANGILTFKNGVSAGAGVKAIFSTEPGTAYEVTFDYTATAATTTASLQATGGSMTTISPGAVTYTFTASAAQTVLTLIPQGANTLATLDNFKVTHEHEEVVIPEGVTAIPSCSNVGETYTVHAMSDNLDLAYVPNTTASNSRWYSMSGSVASNVTAGLMYFSASGSGIHAMGRKFTAVAGKTYSISLKTWKQSASDNNLVVRIRRVSDGVDVYSSASNTVPVSATVSGALSINLSGVFTAPDNAEYIIVLNRTGGNNVAVFFDDIDLRYEDMVYNQVCTWYAVDGYRFGFNGKEKVDEWNGESNIYDYGFRIYDPRIARFLSVDPLTQNFPWYTPYQFAGNKPIWAIDIDGLEEQETTENGFLITATYAVVSSGDGAVPNAADIVNLQSDINLALNKNPGVMVPFGSLTNEKLKENIKANFVGPLPQDGNIDNELVHVNVQFNINVIDGGTKLNASNMTTAYDKDLMSIDIGGVIFLGKPGSSSFDDPTTGLPNPDVAAAYTGNDFIELNPKFFDPTDPSYTGYNSANPNGVLNTVLHEGPGHDMYLEGSVFHPKGKYPPVGLMSDSGGDINTPTMEEMQVIINKVPQKNTNR